MTCIKRSKDLVSWVGTPDLFYKLLFCFQFFFSTFQFTEVVLSVCFLPFMFLDFTKVADLTELIGGGDKGTELKKSLYKNEMYQKIMKKELPRFLKLGFMDV
jgi:hypothetical protein